MPAPRTRPTPVAYSNGVVTTARRSADPSGNRRRDGATARRGRATRSRSSTENWRDPDRLSRSRLMGTRSHASRMHTANLQHRRVRPSRSAASGPHAVVEYPDAIAATPVTHRRTAAPWRSRGPYRGSSLVESQERSPPTNGHDSGRQELMESMSKRASGSAVARTSDYLLPSVSLPACDPRLAFRGRHEPSSIRGALGTTVLANPPTSLRFWQG